MQFRKDSSSPRVTKQVEIFVYATELWLQGVTQIQIKAEVVPLVSLKVKNITNTKLFTFFTKRFAR